MRRIKLMNVFEVENNEMNKELISYRSAKQIDRRLYKKQRLRFHSIDAIVMTFEPN